MPAHTKMQAIPVMSGVIATFPALQDDDKARGLPSRSGSAQAQAQAVGAEGRKDPQENCSWHELNEASGSLADCRVQLSRRL